MKKTTFTTFALVGWFGFAASSQAQETFAFDFSGTIDGNGDLTQLLTVGSTSLTMTVLGASTFAGQDGDLNYNGTNLGVAGGTGNKVNVTLDYKENDSGDADAGAFESFIISFDKDVTLNSGGFTGGFQTGNRNGSEFLRWVSSDTGTPEDTGGGTASFSNITTLTAGQTLTVTSFNSGGLASSATVSLQQLTVQAVPEPSSLALFAGALGLCYMVARRRK